ncbi:hypothetical protein LENED_009255 [Lentinula edodes]|uniref:Uncharacterized protein n=1 Tax=Lentinula edodes TaxID=5353 RepID=A0A1Q3EJ78_LENED|nr:hypothetical protein LENED_009255 [Lentinula edodes]
MLFLGSESRFKILRIVPKDLPDSFQNFAFKLTRVVDSTFLSLNSILPRVASSVLTCCYLRVSFASLHGDGGEREKKNTMLLFLDIK